MNRPHLDLESQVRLKDRIVGLGASHAAYGVAGLDWTTRCMYTVQMLVILSFLPRWM
jgi:hypothetical protein